MPYTILESSDVSPLRCGDFDANNKLATLAACAGCGRAEGYRHRLGVSQRIQLHRSKGGIGPAIVSQNLAVVGIRPLCNCHLGDGCEVGTTSTTARML
jgi:hypothetical protein